MFPMAALILDESKGINMTGKEIDFNYYEALQLFADQFEFAQNQLK